MAIYQLDLLSARYTYAHKQRYIATSQQGVRQGDVPASLLFALCGEGMPCHAMPYIATSQQGVRQGDVPASLLFALVFTEAALAQKVKVQKK